MMEFSALNLLVREAVNGTMALSALLLVIIFGRYSWRNRFSLARSQTTQAALAIMILMCGHLVRAGSSWVEFLLIDMGLSAAGWIKWTWIWFLIAAALIVVGKGMMAYTFAPRAWRRAIFLGAIPACILIPLLIALTVALLS